MVTNLAGTNLAHNFSPRLFAQSLLQYNDSADLWSVSFRFGWLQDANTGLFIVYNETEGLRDFIPSGAGRRVILKYSYLFDLGGGHSCGRRCHRRNRCDDRATARTREPVNPVRLPNSEVPPASGARFPPGSVRRYNALAGLD